MSRITGDESYKGCRISYTITPIGNQFSSFAKIISINSHVTLGEVIRDENLNSAEEAKIAILKKAMEWIDSHV